MRGTPGISGRVFSALGSHQVNVIAIAQGSSECSISIVVAAEDTASAAPEPALPEALASDEEPATKLDHLLDVRLPLTIRLGSTRMNLDDVLRLTVGSIVELDQLEDEPLDVLAIGRVVARPELLPHSCRRVAGAGCRASLSRGRPSPVRGPRP